ncbi:hypothetical protein LB505_010868 [Fusarium chuoi]|nr:hypothetical protein LB505_010868 [Fusarium chuoi]
MGGSALAQTLGQIGNESPDVRDVQIIRDFFDALWQLHQEDIVLAYHDRSDGGLLTTVAEMMFAGRCGADISLDNLAESEDKVLRNMWSSPRSYQDYRLCSPYQQAISPCQVQIKDHYRPGACQDPTLVD